MYGVTEARVGLGGEALNDCFLETLIVLVAEAEPQLPITETLIVLLTEAEPQLLITETLLSKVPEPCQSAVYLSAMGVTTTRGTRETSSRAYTVGHN